MSPSELCQAGLTLYGGWGWQTKLAEDLGVDGSTVRRWISGASPISQQTAVAIRSMVELKLAEEAG